MAYAIASTLMICFFSLSSFKAKKEEKSIDEIIAKKITIVGEDNLPRMVLSNENRQHSGRMNGKEWPKRERPSGIIFFNNQGDECGGLVYQTKEKDGNIISGMSFTMDNYKDDQVVQILNDEFYANGKAYVQRGININQYPTGTNIDDRNKKIEAINTIADEKERKQKLQELFEKRRGWCGTFVGMFLCFASIEMVRDEAPGRSAGCARPTVSSCRRSRTDRAGRRAGTPGRSWC